MLRKLPPALTTLAIAAMTTLATAMPANASGLTITAGFMIQSDTGFCTVSFPDPIHPAIVYTAGHCYKGARKVSLGDFQIGEYVPEIYSAKLDLIAIRLYANVPSQYSLMSREPLLGPWVPHVGTKVCKYGATTQETCGTVVSVSDDLDRFSVKMTADHGDSGGPVYEHLDPDGDGEHHGVHPLGIILSENDDDPTIINCASMLAIEGFLENTWGTNWKMD